MYDYKNIIIAALFVYCVGLIVRNKWLKAELGRLRAQIEGRPWRVESRIPFFGGR